jgi:hypothetical protein
MEVLAYWLIYFEPYIEDEEKAYQSGLFPFRYKDKFLLALGGCGMDLSPKLDCYQALTDSSLPAGSQIFRQVDFFDYVSPVKCNEIFEKCKLNEPKLTLVAFGKD